MYARRVAINSFRTCFSIKKCCLPCYVIIFGNGSLFAECQSSRNCKICFTRRAIILIRIYKNATQPLDEMYDHSLRVVSRFFVCCGKHREHKGRYGRGFFCIITRRNNKRGKQSTKISAWVFKTKSVFIIPFHRIIVFVVVNYFLEYGRNRIYL